MEKAALLCKRLGELKALRSPFEAHWGECYKYGAPERQQAFNGESGTFHTAKNDRVKLIDSTASEAILNSMVPSLISGTTPANAIWFKAVPDGMDDPTVLTGGEQWLEQSCQFVWRNIHGANFDSEVIDYFTDWSVAGWSVMYSDVDRKKNAGYVFQTWPIGECWIASTRQDYQVDTIFRVFEITAAALVAEYGAEKLPLSVIEAARSTPDSKFELLWVIEPREGAKLPVDDRPILPKNMPFAAYHVLTGAEKAIIRESGYNEFPCSVSRYRRIPGSVYGTGAMSTALPDTKQLQVMQRDFSRALQMAALGLYAGEDDGVFNPATMVIAPGRVVTVNKTDSLKRIDDSRAVPMLDAAIEKLQGTIRRKLLADMMTPQYGQPMTAAETYARVDQVRQQIGPLYGRIQSEFLIPLLERLIGIAYRAEKLGAAPEDLQGKNLSFKFVSPLARAQRLEEVGSLERFLQALPLLRELDPSAVDNFDSDAATQFMAQGLGVSASVMRTEDKLKEHREKKAQAQQQAQAQEQQAAMAQQMTGAVAQGMGKGLEEQMASEVMQ